MMDYGEMIELVPDSGVDLLHAWGLPEWPRHVEAKYFLWEKCCVFAIMANDEGGIDGHMALRVRHHGKRRRRDRWSYGDGSTQTQTVTRGLRGFSGSLGPLCDPRPCSHVTPTRAERGPKGGIC
ncbi:hypothetical protein [Escherichia phage vB-Eco-KMB41]|nr:hypothetical protein [Escherichia phage vB-Eco-KMB41]